jgi:threonylcarbamoyladenosine tRNA methylthiotransferase MtaB
VARGEERSRSIAEIVQEINQLTTQGVQEIVLTGVHVGGYGSDLDSSLYELVQTILRDTYIPRIRFASVEPWDLPDNFFELFLNPRIMPHMHLPIQSGADSVLRRMARRCKTTEFSELVSQARRILPHFNVTTDIIVGFPGETADDWQQTLDFVEKIGFGHIHIFSYSTREGTKAARLSEQVAEPLKKQRSQVLHTLAEQQKQAFLQQQIGQTVAVLWEYARPLNDSQQVFTGYTPNYCKVQVVVDKQLNLSNKISLTQLQQVDTAESALLGLLV